MEELKEEQLKQALSNALVHFNQQGLSLGTEFYVLKDVFNEFSNTYQQYINQQLEKQQKQEKEIENNETIVEEGVEE